MKSWALMSGTAKTRKISPTFEPNHIHVTFSDPWLLVCEGASFKFSVGIAKNEENRDFARGYFAIYALAFIGLKCLKLLLYVS